MYLAPDSCVENDTTAPLGPIGLTGRSCCEAVDLIS